MTDLGIPPFGMPPLSADRAHYVLDRGAGFVLSIHAFGLACCAVEVVAAAMADEEITHAEETPVDPGRPRYEVMVVSGTVTDKMAPAVLRHFQKLPASSYVISFGSCANSGGPYWDSYCVTKGVDQIVPVDVYVPGCPPRPEAFVAGLRALHRTVEASRG
ncbi:MAG: NADH-quinone oxidoreductase subunit NuoB [Nocardioidaceae bacterium]